MGRRERRIWKHLEFYIEHRVKKIQNKIKNSSLGFFLLTPEGTNNSQSADSVSTD